MPGMEEEEDRGRLKRETPLYTFSTVSPRMRDLLDVLVPLPSFLKGKCIHSFIVIRKSQHRSVCVCLLVHGRFLLPFKEHRL